MAKAEVVQGDCVERLGGADHARYACRFDLAVADPPYNLGFAYESAVDDRKAAADYLAWTRQWLAAVTPTLTPDGTLWVFVPEEWASRVDVMAQDEFGYHKRRQVTWAFTFGQAAQKNFTKSSCFLLYLTRKKAKFFFDDAAVRVPSARQLVYGDRRANPAGKQPDATWMLVAEQLAPYATPDRDVWLQSRVCGTYKERVPDMPNQIPLPLYERVVRATCPPGGAVLDPFAGSFGLGEVCLRLGRDYLGVELGPKTAEAGRLRLDRVAAELAAAPPADKKRPKRA